mmetsp:Transcript_61208/g.138510  ORF Transcript_61208/g.138510 Transcript_61208/m.138510 type:complete len:234 (-) Transcript_61208:156-857(-)
MPSMGWESEPKDTSSSSALASSLAPSPSSLAAPWKGPPASPRPSAEGGRGGDRGEAEALVSVSGSSLARTGPWSVLWGPASSTGAMFAGAPKAVSTSALSNAPFSSCCLALASKGVLGAFSSPPPSSSLSSRSDSSNSNSSESSSLVEMISSLPAALPSSSEGSPCPAARALGAPAATPPFAEALAACLKRMSSGLRCWSSSWSSYTTSYSFPGMDESTCVTEPLRQVSSSSS